MGGLETPSIVELRWQSAQLQIQTRRSPRWCAPTPEKSVRWLDGRGLDWNSPSQDLIWRQEMTAALFHSLSHHRAHARNILHQVIGHAVPLLQIFGTVVGNPHLPACVLRYQRLQGQIDRERGRGYHQWSSGLGTAEDDQLGCGHLHPNLFRFPAVIHQGEHLQSLLGQNGLKALHSLLHRIRTRDLHQTFRFHDPLPPSCPPERGDRGSLAEGTSPVPRRSSVNVSRFQLPTRNPTLLSPPKSSSPKSPSR